VQKREERSGKNTEYLAISAHGVFGISSGATEDPNVIFNELNVKHRAKVQTVKEAGKSNTPGRLLEGQKHKKPDKSGLVTKQPKEVQKGKRNYQLLRIVCYCCASVVVVVVTRDDGN